ncbi:MAG: site-2 protease family protein [Solirubrobacterales bacterium]
MSRSVRIGRLAGIPIGVQPLWLLIVGLITWSLGAVYFPDRVDGIAPLAAYALGLACALLLFASILLHELGHSLVARRHGIEVEEVDLWLLGGVARMSGYPKAAGDELRFAAAGPAVTAAIAAVFGLVAVALPDSTPAALRAVVDYQLFVNAAILVFNLIPAFPLDGGRIARALLWMRSGDLGRATHTAAALGRAIGYAMIALGLLATAAGLLNGLWFALVGFFVSAAARAEENGLLIRTAFSGREAGRLMTFPALTIPARTTVAAAVSEYFGPRGYVAFPVLDGERLAGLVDVAAIERVPLRERQRVTVGEVASYEPGLVVDEDQDVAELLERPAFERVGRAVVVTRDGGFGIVSITDVRRVLRALELGGSVPPRTSPA